MEIHEVKNPRYGSPTHIIHVEPNELPCLNFRTYDGNYPRSIFGMIKRKVKGTDTLEMISAEYKITE